MTLLMAFTMVCLLPPSAVRAASLRFAAGQKGEFHFDTGVLKGVLRAEGKSKGFTSVVHAPSGMRVDRNTMGLLSPYRVFKTNYRYASAAWDWPSQANLEDDGSVSVLWPVEKDRPFELKARYVLVDSETLSVEFQVKAVEILPAFEVFLASYFDTPFTNAMVLAKGSEGGAAHWISATQAQGDWQMFPREDAVIPMIQDGRWKQEPNPVDWFQLQKFSEPKAMRRAGSDGLAAILSADTKDCFAVSMPFQTEGHYSLYFSLFGKTINAGETAVAKARMQITSRPEASGR
jgi:hypothetical protein